MTLYSVLVADCELQTVDCTGITEITVRELKKLHPITGDTPEQPWHSMDDDARLVYAPDESAFGQLHIFEWNNPPYDLALYNEKSYVYGIEGNWGPQFLDDLLSYLKQHIKPEQNVDLIRFWAGEYDRTLKSRRIHIAEIESHHLESLQNEQYICVAFV